VWFIGRHSRHHLELCRDYIKVGPRWVTGDFLVISVTAIVLILPLALRFNLTDIHELFAASIVLIAGLTLPHMIVTHTIPARATPLPETNAAAG